MAVKASRSTTIIFTGDRTQTQTVPASDNANSPGQEEVKRLAAGDNTINVPNAGTVPVACTIEMPASNPNLIKLKGVGGDTGVNLHKTDPTTIALDPSQASFVLNAAAQTDVRLLWT